MARVYVVGGGGSGKSTLAAVLGQRLGCPVVHMDELYARAAAAGGPADAVRARWAAAVLEAARRDAWIAEGNFPGWMEELASRADLVVWLDIPFRVAAWRILKRHVLADLRRCNPYPGYRTLWRFLRNQRRYYGDTGDAYARRLATGGDRWSGVYYGRAAVAAYAAALEGRVLRVRGGHPRKIAHDVVSALQPAGVAAGARRSRAVERPN